MSVEIEDEVTRVLLVFYSKNTDYINEICDGTGLHKLNVAFELLAIKN